MNRETGPRGGRRQRDETRDNLEAETGAKRTKALPYVTVIHEIVLKRTPKNKLINAIIMVLVFLLYSND